MSGELNPGQIAYRGDSVLLLLGYNTIALWNNREQGHFEHLDYARHRLRREVPVCPSQWACCRLRSN